MSEDTKQTDTQWTHIDALMKAGGQITLGRMAPLEGVAVAVDDGDIYAVLRRRPEESFTALLERLDKAIGVAKRWTPYQRSRRQTVRTQAAEYSQEAVAVKRAFGTRLRF